MKSWCAEAPTGRVAILFMRPIQMRGFVLGVCWWEVCFVRAGNAFWSLLLQLAAQVLVPGVGDVASASTGRAALAVGRLPHPLITTWVSFF